MRRPKLIYLARRNPGLQPEEFRPRWRAHGALGMSMARWKNVWRYVHCDVLGGDREAAGYDGVGIVWHRSPAARLAHRSDQSAQAEMEQDERATFDALVANNCALYAEEVVQAPSVEAGAKLIWFVEGRAEPDVALLAQAVLSEALQAAGPALRGRVRNRRTPPETRAWGLRYPLIEEMWFADAASAGVARGQLVAVMERQQSPLSGLALITNEVLLYGLPEDA